MHIQIRPIGVAPAFGRQLPSSKVLSVSPDKSVLDKAGTTMPKSPDKPGRFKRLLQTLGLASVLGTAGCAGTQWSITVSDDGPYHRPPVVVHPRPQPPVIVVPQEPCPPPVIYRRYPQPRPPVIIIPDHHHHHRSGRHRY